MKILFITSRFPYPLEKGDKLRSYHIIRELSKDHDIILASLSEHKVENKHIEQLKPYAKQILVVNQKKVVKFYNAGLAVFKDIPIQVGYFYNKNFKKLINSIIEKEKPDHIFCQLLRTSYYVKDIKNIPKTLDYQDALSLGIKRRIEKSNFLFSLFLKIEYKKLLAFEKKIFDWFEHKIIISEQDRKHILHPRQNEIEIILNGVDFDYFNPDKVKEANEKIDILFTGNMQYPPNVNCAKYIAKEILPLLKKTHPEIKIFFVGANPSKSVLNLQNENIKVTSWVDDIRPYYKACKIFFAPMQIGTGLQNKLLEAMAMKKPCITSNLANSSLGARKGIEILVGNTPEEYVELIKLLLSSNETYNEISKNGYEFVKNNYSWEKNINKLKTIISGGQNNL